MPVEMTPREIELIRLADLEASHGREDASKASSNMPPTSLNMSISKPDGKGFRKLTFQGNLYETNFMDDVSQRFEENELIEKQKKK